MSKKSEFLRCTELGVKTEDEDLTVKEEPIEDVGMVTTGICDESGKRLHGDPSSGHIKGESNDSKEAQTADAHLLKCEEISFKPEMEEVSVKEEPMEDCSTTYEGNGERLQGDTSSLHVKEETRRSKRSHGSKKSPLPSHLPFPDEDEEIEERASSYELQTSVKFCVTLGKTPEETVAMMQKAYPKEGLEEAVIRRWFQSFKENGDAQKLSSFEDFPPAGRRPAEVIDNVRDAIRLDRTLTVGEIAERSGLPPDTCSDVLKKDLEMVRVCGHWVPGKLSEDLRDERKYFCQDLIDEVENDPEFLLSIVTCGEVWCKLSDDPLKEASGKDSVLLTVFFDAQGIIYHEFLPEGAILTRSTYEDAVKSLLKVVKDKRSKLYDTKKLTLHHSGIASHQSLGVREFLTQHCIPALSHPLDSPDIFPSGFFLLPRLKSLLGSVSFSSLGETHTKVEGALRKLTGEETGQCFRRWYTRMQSCVAANGSYLEESRIP